ncbi:uncharacterized protein L201_004988 [Kwoniella dendrophila CBS 6074]|uniref:Stretch-activated cation channel Mid1 n=1 Tax=Kwoniella dendrophila CBS 6074 TaxID=1295534 RepID=A0AAX4JX91_9TREE
MSIDQPIPQRGLTNTFRKPSRFQKNEQSRLYCQHSYGYTIFLGLLLLILLPSTCLAQDSTSTSTSALASSTISSTRTTISSSRTTSISTSTVSASSSSIASATKTYSIPSLPTTVTLPALNKTTPLIQLVLPQVNPIYLTFSICTLTSNTTLLPTILLTTLTPEDDLDDSDNLSFDLGSRPIIDKSSGGIISQNNGNGGGYNEKNNKNGNIWNIILNKGFGNFTLNYENSFKTYILFGLGLEMDGQTLDDLDVVGNLIIQMTASENGPLQTISSSIPFLGDTTSTQALIFSPLLYASLPYEPTYPNYTLPAPQLTFTPLNDLSPESLISGNTSLSNNLTLYVVPTTSNSSPTSNQLDYSTCAISLSVNQTGSLAEKIITKSDSEEPQYSMINDEEGYRHYWTIGGLSPSNNYTAWIKDDQGTWLSPIWFTTKPDSFPCQLVLPTSICPSIAYSAPLPVNSTSISTSSGELISETSPVQTLPDELIKVLIDNLEGFSTSLSAQACGRDLYSHVSSCSDCFSSYRNWLCRLVIPQCGSSTSNTNTNNTAESELDPDSNNIEQQQIIKPFLIDRTNDKPRNNQTYIPEYEYQELLPCLSICNQVDKKCPVNLGFRCPRRKIQNSLQSYAFIGQSSDRGDGSLQGGIPSYDQYGNRWCNG